MIENEYFFFYCYENMCESLTDGSDFRLCIDFCTNADCILYIELIHVRNCYKKFEVVGKNLATCTHKIYTQNQKLSHDDLCELSILNVYSRLACVNSSLCPERNVTTCCCCSVDGGDGLTIELRGVESSNKRPPVAP